jgi:hypothetical protein
VTEQADERQHAAHEEADRHVPQHLRVGPPGPVGAPTQLWRGRARDEQTEVGTHPFQIRMDALPINRLTVDDH